MGKSVVSCPLPDCKGTNLTHHCRHDTDAGRRCAWLVCSHCRIVIDPRRWRAFSTKDGTTVELPAR